ncbi:hypothetical protein [Sphingopyxis sp.]|uniref:hypothetical protein n=1 Tax=Sphingopyxis sp. TaxID=1908224 RepID=UPI0010F67E93|nr:hypothetical protein [Sphingopyxis sp.]MBR2170831.1 hypothetical protein [Sphingopyxis sp.]
MRIAEILKISIIPVILAGCAPAAQKATRDDNIAKYEKAFDSGNDLLTFWIVDLSGGPIKGAVATDDALLQVGSADLLLQALSRCGEARFLVNHGLTHHEVVSVPVKANNPFRTLSDFELVDCVRKIVSFSFGAGIGREPDGDSSPFKSLYAQKN